MGENFLSINKNDNRFKEILRRNKVKSISIFGSYATGEKKSLGVRSTLLTGHGWPRLEV
jgi:hypothetical protein